MKFGFESSPQKDSKTENDEGAINKLTESEKLSLGKKIRNLAIAATVLGITTPALGQKTKNQEKKLEPIEVANKNDPRLKAYTDSLKIYNLTKKDIDFDFPKQKILYKYDEILRNNPDASKDDNFIREYRNAFSEYRKERDEYLKNLRAGDSKNARPAKYASYKGIKPVRYIQKFEGDENYFAPVYKKPVQQVIYKKPETKKDTLTKIQKPILKRALDSVGKNLLPEIKETRYKPEQRKTNWSFVYPGENGLMNTIYFNSKAEYDEALLKAGGGKPIGNDNYLGSKQQGEEYSTLFRSKPEY